MRESDEEKIRQQVDDFLKELGSSPKSVPDESPDEKALLEDEQYEIEGVNYEEEKQKLFLEQLKEDKESRKSYSSKIFCLIVIWLIAVFTLIILDSLKVLEIPEKTIITLIGGTTLNVFGLFHFVLKYLYQTPKDKN